MTDRVRALTVILSEDMRTDDVQPLVDAISLLQGVGHVEKQASTSADAIALVRAKLELQTKIWEVLKP